ncbi:hypothetical protein P7C70_g7720, partial [Phenoliferia sp. Uapishka_3]
MSDTSMDLASEEETPALPIASPRDSDVSLESTSPNPTYAQSSHQTADSEIDLASDGNDNVDDSTAYQGSPGGPPLTPDAPPEDLRSEDEPILAPTLSTNERVPSPSSHSDVSLTGDAQQTEDSGAQRAQHPLEALFSSSASDSSSDVKEDDYVIYTPPPHDIAADLAHADEVNPGFEGDSEDSSSSSDSSSSDSDDSVESEPAAPLPFVTTSPRPFTAPPTLPDLQTSKFDHDWPSDWVLPDFTQVEDTLAQLERTLGLSSDLLEDEAEENPAAAATLLAFRKQKEGHRSSSKNTAPLASHMYIQPPSSNATTLTNDIIVDLPKHSQGWDYLDPTPIEERFTAEWLLGVPREKRMFLLVPIKPSVKSNSVESTQDWFNMYSAAIQCKDLAQYVGIVYRLVKWMREQGRTAEDMLPLQPKDTLLYIGSLAGTCRLGTIEKVISALRWWHSLHFQELELPKALWRIAKRGVKALAPVGAILARAVDMSDLEYVISTLKVTGDDANPHDIAFKACILATFHSMARLRETTSERVKSPVKGYTATTSSVRWVAATPTSAARALIHIPYDKTHQEAGRDLIIVSQSANPAMCPLIALQHHIAVNNPPPTMGLFSYFEDNKPGVLRQMTKSYLVNNFNRILLPGGRSKISGHSFRRGGATYYLTMKVNPEIIQAVGGWKGTSSFLLYWRQHSLIAARTMADLQLDTIAGDEISIQSLLGDNNDDEYDETTVDSATPSVPFVSTSRVSRGRESSLSQDVSTPSASSDENPKRPKTRSMTRPKPNKKPSKKSRK